MWYKQHEKHIEVFIFVKANAKITQIVGKNEQHLHITLHAKPQDGEANKELICYLAKYLSIPKTAISLHRGEHSRYKTIIIPSNTSLSHL